MSEEEGEVRRPGNANPICSSGRSTGTPATRISRSDWRSEKFDAPKLLGPKNYDGSSRMRKQYKSFWRLRKEKRRKNLEDLRNNKDTPATKMMKERGITGEKYQFKK